MFRDYPSKGKVTVVSERGTNSVLSVFGSLSGTRADSLLSELTAEGGCLQV